MVSKLLRDERKAPYTFTFCPYCGGALPTLSIIDGIEEGDGN